MGEKTGIAWTDHTFNGWWICTEVSPGCDNCYARALAHRWGYGWGKGVPRRLLSDKHWLEPLKWNAKAEKEGKRHRVFTSSMADWADSEVPTEWRARLWELIRQTPWLDWQMLTKRAITRTVLPADWWDYAFGYPNVWLGVSVESPAYEFRIHNLLKIPAEVHWVSAEPLLADLHYDAWRGVDWWVIGGESSQAGRKARPFDVQWARNAIQSGKRTGAKIFIKQLGSSPYDKEYHLPVVWHLNDHHGADMTEWEEDLRVREFPVQT